MSIADRLFAEAMDIATQHQNIASHLEREILDLESQLQEKKAALHLASVATKRARDFVPMRGADFYCPACWVAKEENAKLHPIPNDVMRCNACSNGFPV